MMKTSTTLKKTLLILKISFVFSVLFFAQAVWAASLSLSPSTGVYSSGQTFTARVIVNTTGSSINAADGTITFNPNELSVVGVTKGPIFSLWTAEPSFSNSAGTVSFSGGSPSGYTGSAGTVLNITFRAKGSGATRVNFSSGSVLAADGLGTNVLTNMGGGSYTISAAAVVPSPEVIIEYVPPANTPAAPKVTSTSHPDDQKWYREKTAELAWVLPAGVTAVRTLLDYNPNSIPTKVYSNPIDAISIEDLSEGEQYFHIQFQNEDGWGSVTHYRLAVDTTAPTNLILSLPDEVDLSNPTQTITVEVTEEISLVERYVIRIDGGDPIEYIDETGSSTIVLTDLQPGYRSVVVEAFDQAGNSTTGNISFTVLAFDKPVFTEYPSEINEEVIPVIKGQTRPDSEVTVTIKRVSNSDVESSSEQTYTVQSTAEGEFTIIPEGTFPLGVYELVAVATDQYGAQSELSDPVRIAVQKPGYLQFGSLVISILSVIIPLIALLGLAGFMMWYLFAALRRTKRTVSREAAEALDMLAKEFSALDNELKQHENSMAASRKTKKLTKAEATVLASLRTSLKESRDRVKKEITDVEDIVD